MQHAEAMDLASSALLVYDLQQKLVCALQTARMYTRNVLSGRRFTLEPYVERRGSPTGHHSKPQEVAAPQWVVLGPRRAIVANIRPIQLQQKGRTQEYTMTREVDAYIHQYGSLANPEMSASRAARSK